MFTSVKQRAITMLSTSALVVASFSLAPAVRAQSPQASLGLAGPWSVTVSLTDCHGNPKGTFPSIVMFSRGGTVTESTFNPAFDHGQRGPGLGVWWLNEDGTYSSTDVAYILFTSAVYSPGPPPIGFAAGTQKITHRITLSSDASNWSDIAQVQFFDINHNPLNHACATATAVRLQ
jgi:hypothetical protein